MTKGSDLYHLQKLDSEKDSRLRRLTQVRAALKEDKSVKQSRQAVEDARVQARKRATKQRTLELESQGISSEITNFEERLYSGVVENPKELAEIQAKVASLRRRQKKLDDDLLKAMIEREEAEAAHVQAQKHLDETEESWSIQQTDLRAEQEALQEKLASIEEARANLLPNIEASDLATYQALRRQKEGGLAVAQAQGGSCGACGVTISSGLKWDLRQNGLVCCNNCKRIIVRP